MLVCTLDTIHTTLGFCLLHVPFTSASYVTASFGATFAQHGRRLTKCIDIGMLHAKPRRKKGISAPSHRHFSISWSLLGQKGRVAHSIDALFRADECEKLGMARVGIANEKNLALSAQRTANLTGKNRLLAGELETT